ncbi:Chorismate binding domain-containing protein [Emticicia oligotrophica DSM 17448]|uniref:isochorismate synthase n=1 Tax=Emticicia oligotrophica (strain DSM 17448 / CIP 109782 / MTCC 6937 / GPTSA100-15) TaxID=929562 RepID=A0ABN4AMT6_EMTOG|nr:isochorismate synthase [Emticicia oligotrophica]AFK03492.1 Chorismate binding domain-containing protein [Emticicia oligotrophica DSM 17448]
MTTTVIENSTFRQNLWNSAQSLAFPTALWRLPKQTEKHFLISFDGIPQKSKIDFEELGSGFAFSPFENPDGQQTLFLKADLHYIFDINESNTNEFVKEVITPSALNPNFVALTNGLSKANPPKQKKQISKQTQPEDFIQLVNQAISEIKRDVFKKVVLSRTKQIVLPSNFDVVSTFDKLCQAYPSAFVSAVSLPHLGVVWMGASPETLVSQDSKGIFRTMALAGTQSAYDADGNLIKTSEALWRQKEIEEQSFVTRYIINCLKKIRVREFEEEGPKTVIAGNLMHLRTDILIDTIAINFPQLATVMLDLLHPTSAVCGMPKADATAFILANEGYDREFYSGFLGPVNIQKGNGETESQIFVNLRTMKVEDNLATLYAGCGITIDSNPEKEWQETEMKTQTLGKILNTEI